MNTYTIMKACAEKKEKCFCALAATVNVVFKFERFTTGKNVLETSQLYVTNRNVSPFKIWREFNEK